MATPPSPIQVLYNRNGKVSLIWERDTSGNNLQYWKLYWSNRCGGPYSNIFPDIRNARGYGNRYVRFDFDRADYSIRDDQNFYLRLSSVDWDGVETPASINDLEGVLTTKIVYENGATLTSRFNFHEVDYQQAGATDIDYVTPDAYDGTLMYVKLTRDANTTIDIFVSLIPVGSDVTSLLPGQEIILHHEENFTGYTFNLPVEQLITDLDNRQVRVRTTDVAGGEYTLTVGRRKLYTYATSEI